MGDWKNLTESGAGLQGATNSVTWKPWVVLEDRRAKQGSHPCLDHGSLRVTSPGTNSGIRVGSKRIFKVPFSPNLSVIPRLKERCCFLLKAFCTSEITLNGSGQSRNLSLPPLPLPRNIKLPFHGREKGRRVPASKEPARHDCP